MKICSVCGKRIKDFVYSGGTCSQDCFYRQFWQEKIRSYRGEVLNELAIVTPDLNVYTIVPDGKPGDRFLGHGGHTFHIHFLNKPRHEIVKSNNLWYNGNLLKDNCPPDLQASLLPNAELVRVVRIPWTQANEIISENHLRWREDQLHEYNKYLGFID